LYQSLSYAFQHAELLPLFEVIRAKRHSDHPLVLAGMDIQEQGYDSESRPVVLHDALDTIDAELADRAASLDTALFLLSRFGGLEDDAYAWALVNGDSAKAVYNEAASVTQGWVHWVFRLATGWIDRLAVRGRAAAEDTDTPTRYYELRDEWMAKAVSALADSIDGARKVVVLLHNDHARYSDFGFRSEAHRSTGGYLREQYGDAVYSIGFFMGHGTIADNGRKLQTVAVPDSGGIERFLGEIGAPASYVILRGNRGASVRAWASTSKSYLRMGIRPMTMVPADEFDALVYIDSVGPPEYKIP
jgi:erythromycin esterase